MIENDLRFLLRDKYNLNELEVSEYITGAITPDRINKSDVENDVKLLKSGYPLAYIIGYVDFLNCKIDLRYKPLIPRIETEYWVDAICKSGSLKNNLGINCLDLCCGSGCIGVAILNIFPDSNVVFSDIDEDAIKQTEYNLKLNGIDDLRYKVVKSDLFDELSEDTKFDVILTNPPYVSESDVVELSTKHEPQNALYADEDGLMIIKEILINAPNYLEKTGTMYMEFGSEQKGKFEDLLKTMPSYRYTFHKDQFERWRWVEIKV